jgi:hypothetical protein
MACFCVCDALWLDTSSVVFRSGVSRFFCQLISPINSHPPLSTYTYPHQLPSTPIFEMFVIWAYLFFLLPSQYLIHP